MRDLIEAGLSEPADALATYGISAAPLVAGDRACLIGCHQASEDDGVLAALVEIIDAPHGYLRRLRGGTAVLRVDLQDGRDGGSSAQMPRRCHVLRSIAPLIMTYRTKVGVARRAIAGAWR